MFNTTATIIGPQAGSTWPPVKQNRRYSRCARRSHPQHAASIWDLKGDRLARAGQDVDGQLIEALVWQAFFHHGVLVEDVAQERVCIGF